MTSTTGDHRRRFVRDRRWDEAIMKYDHGTAQIEWFSPDDGGRISGYPSGSDYRPTVIPEGSTSMTHYSVNMNLDSPGSSSPSGGGTVDIVPERTRSGVMNEQHVNICLGPGECPFGPLQPTPAPKGERIR